MKAFAALYAALDETTSLNEKVAAMAAHLAAASPADAAWAIYFLSGERPKRLVSAPKLRAWAAAEAGIPDWLFEECYQQAGDLAEAIALLLPDRASDERHGLAWWVEERLLPLRAQPEDVQRERIVEAWRLLGGVERFVWNKLITGAFRVGVSQKLLVRALAQASGIAEDVLAHRLMGTWEPTPEFHARLLAADATDAEASRPYPFCLAYPLEEPPHSLGERGEWQVEWKWDGIRAQLVRRAGRTWLWSRGEELLDGRFPEVEAVGAFLPDGTVLDGELLPWREDRPLPFAQLQRRIGRKTLGRKLLAEVPVVLVAFDLLEDGGADLRPLPLAERRARLERLVASLPTGASVRVSPLVDDATWEALAATRERSRETQAEGFMLKRRTSAYSVGRRRGDWWKWKVAPFTVDAVLIYAQAGHGRRAGLYTDYTFGLWDGDQLVPFAKAYSGLTDEEIREVDAFVRRHTLERFGPVRTVEPRLVFELAFEGIQRSTRHKSGIAVRFPRMLRWRHDKTAADADRLEDVRRMIAGDG